MYIRRFLSALIHTSQEWTVIPLLESDWKAPVREVHICGWSEYQWLVLMTSESWPTWWKGVPLWITCPLLNICQKRYSTLFLGPHIEVQNFNDLKTFGKDDKVIHTLLPYFDFLKYGKPALLILPDTYIEHSDLCSISLLLLTSAQGADVYSWVIHRDLSCEPGFLMLVATEFQERK